MTATIATDDRNRHRVRPARIALHVFLIATALVWLVPIAGAIYTSLRPYGETSQKGFFSLPDTLTFDNYRNAFTQGDMARHYWVTFCIVVPALMAFLHLDQRRASATSLVAIAPAAVVGAITYAVQGEVHWLAALTLAPAIIGN